MYKVAAVSVFLLVVMVMLLGTCAGSEMLPVKHHPATDVYDGWRLGTQAWTFRKFTFYEAVDKTASLGLNWIEAYPSQRLSKERPNVKFGHDTPTEIREQVKQKLKDAGVKLVNYGVVGLPNDEAECRKVFDFAKDMGIETLVSEPPEEAFDLLEKLCEEYKIKVAIHNHPKPSRYWDPDKVLAVCKGRSKLIGACADTGHWMRSGINPLRALKKLARASQRSTASQSSKGRIISLHFKDIGDGHDVPWGTGECDVKAMLEELNRQNFKGVFSIEYEYNWENSVPEIRQCVEYFNKVASKLTPLENHTVSDGRRRPLKSLTGLKPTGWRDLLAKGLSNCIYKPGSWAMENGVLTLKGGGYIWTKEKLGDFILDLEFKVDKGGNSGVFIRTGDIANFIHTGIEVQIHESTDGTTRGACGAIYDCLSPSKEMAKKTGEWNHYTITCQANKIYVVLNGEQIIDMDLNLWTEAHKNPDGTPNKFNTAYKDMPRVGHIGFQDHGDPVWYRNIKIKTLGD